MNKKLVLAAPCLAMLAACGGSGTNTPAEAPNLTSASAGSVVLSADTPAEASSVDELLSVNFNESPVGSSVEITDGILEGIAITVEEPIGGLQTVSITGVEGGDLGDFELTAAEDLDLFLKAAMNTIDVEADDNGTISDNENGVYTGYNERTLGTTTRFLYYSTVGTDGENVEASVEDNTIGNNNTLSFSVIRDSDSAFTLPTGEFTYQGPTDVFIRRSDNTDTNPYRSVTSTLTVDFTDQTGNYTANDFVSVDPGAPAREISIESDFNVDPNVGTLSYSNGNASVDGDGDTVAIEGVFSPDGNAVAGFIVPQDDSDLEGGIFTMTKQ